jgi:hypothetical protein
MDDNTFTPVPTPNTVRSINGQLLTAPDGWMLLPPGDAALTRRVKAAGDHWVVQEKKGRKTFSRGVWAPAAAIERIRSELEAERAAEEHAKRKAADARRRVKAQADLPVGWQAVRDGVDQPWRLVKNEPEGLERDEAAER